MRTVIVDLVLLGVIALATALAWFEPWYLRPGQEGIYWLSLVADDFTCFAGPVMLGVWGIVILHRLRRSNSELWLGMAFFVWMPVMFMTLYLNMLDWSTDPRHIQSLSTRTHQYHLARFDDSIDGRAWLALYECDTAGILCKYLQYYDIGRPFTYQLTGMEVADPNLQIRYGDKIVGTYALK